MQSSKKPTKAQQAWHSWQRDQGCANCFAANPSIHHCVGSTAKHNKVHIGQWFTIPLCYDCHQNNQGIHHGMGRFIPELGQSRKEIEKTLFANTVFDAYHYFNGASIIPIDVYNEIMDYHK